LLRCRGQALNKLLLTAFAGFVLSTASCGGKVAISITIPAVSSPEIALVRFAPASALLNEGNGLVTSSAAIDFFAPDADLSSLTVSVVDSRGSLVSRTVTPLVAFSGFARGTLAFSVDFNTGLIESYTVTAFVTDRLGHVSNPVFATFRVSDSP
jgi:hypothetical protein